MKTFIISDEATEIFINRKVNNKDIWKYAALHNPSNFNFQKLICQRVLARICENLVTRSFTITLPAALKRLMNKLSQNSTRFNWFGVLEDGAPTHKMLAVRKNLKKTLVAALFGSIAQDKSLHNWLIEHQAIIFYGNKGMLLHRNQLTKPVKRWR